MRGLSLAWLQLTFERRRFVAALAGITFAVILMLLELGIREVLYRASARIPAHITAELVMLHPQDEFVYSTRTFPEVRLYSALAADGVEGIEPVYVQMASWKNPTERTEHMIAVIGAPPASPALDLPGVRENLDKLGPADAALFDSGARPEFGNVAGMLRSAPAVETEINNRRVRIVGLFDAGATFGSGAHVLMSDLGF